MKTYKSIIKNYLPDFMVVLVINILTKYEELRVTRYDRKRFKNNYSSAAKKNRNSIDLLNANLIFYAHSIEKGLSHDNMRLGFGSTKLTALIKNLDQYELNGYSKDGKAYQNALSVIKHYCDIHDSHDYDYLSRNLIPKRYIQLANNADLSLGGVVYINKKDKLNNSRKPFSEIISKRYSIREFSRESVPISVLQEAIEISMKTPTVCNRQSMRVRIIKNGTIIQNVLEKQGGFTGYPAPPVLLVVSTDTKTFINITERNQVYVDGGLFSMSLLLSLESLGLAACPLNAMQTIKNETQIRKMINIPQNENIIMYIAVGQMPEKIGVPKSFRYSADDITTIIK